MMSDTATARKEESMQALPISGGLGAELRGVFIHSQMPQEEVDFIYQMLLKHRVVFFRNQHQITDQSQRDFARNFGEIVSHPTVAAQEEPTILELHSHRGGRANSWHTDVTFDLRPPKLSILRAVTPGPWRRHGLSKHGRRA